MVSLYIAVPSARDWKPAFGASLMGLTYRIASKGLRGEQLTGFGMNAMQGVSCLPRGRQMALDQARSYTHLLMLDDDMVFPDDTAERLLAHNKPVVAANYCRKLPGPSKPLCMDLDGKLLDSTGRSGLQEVAYVGAGILLVDLAAIAHVKPPHFSIVWDEERQEYWSEDLFFCDRLRQAGVQIYVDHDLSNDVAHMGDYPYRFPKPLIALQEAA